MTFVVTLIAGPSGGLDRDLVARAAAALGAAGARAEAPDWLAPDEACDLPFSGLDPGPAEQSLRHALDGAPVDLAVQAAEGRRKALLVADLESTIIAQEMLDELGAALGLRDRIAAITARTMAGELGFEAALDERVGLLAGLPVAALDQAAERMTLNPGARTLVATMRTGGAHTALVTGGFDRFAEPVAALCGFHEVVANRLLIEAGALTGAAARPLVDRDAKLANLERLAAARGLALEAACAVGDGANDAAMLAAAGLGVAYRGKPAARASAKVAIDHGDLTALLYLQGYRRSEFQS